MIKITRKKIHEINLIEENKLKHNIIKFNRNEGQGLHSEGLYHNNANCNIDDFVKFQREQFEQKEFKKVAEIVDLC